MVKIKHTITEIKPHAYRFLKFGVVGASGVLVNMSVYWLLTRLLKIPYYLANPIAIQFSILNNYIWNAGWTWRDHRSGSHGRWLIRLAQFVFVSNLTALGIQWTVFMLLTAKAGIYDLLAQLIGIGCGMVVNFAVNHFYVFQHQKGSKQPVV